MKKFSLVSTTFNEANRIDESIADIEEQTLLPNEIVITDAGSTDGTIEKLLHWKETSELSIRIFVLPKCNVAQGRNHSIDKAYNDLIVSTDFGCRYDKNWLSSIITPFADPKVEVVGGAHTVLEEKICSISAKSSYILARGYLSVMDDSFIPSSRSIAFYKSVWESVGKYPEWLTLASDDLVFGLSLRDKGHHVYIVPRPLVFWGRHEHSMGYVKEAFRYGLGDGEAKINVKTFYLKLFGFLSRPLFFFILIFLLISAASGYIYLLLIPCAIGFKSYYSLYRSWTNFKSEKYDVQVLLYSVFLLERTRFSYIKGYLTGIFKNRLQP
ncbi:MAG TPA: glycosyltransferase [Cytophagaceae bacterium]